MDEMVTAFDALNCEQREAVMHAGGPLLIVAGPGTGKTRTLTTRIAWLMGERGVAAAHVLAVTFSNRAANELRQRLGAMLPGSSIANLHVGTFHAICWQILRSEGRADWSICTQDDRLHVVRHILRNGASPVVPPSGRVDAEKLASAIARLKADLVDIEHDDLFAEASSGLNHGIARAYESTLRNQRLLDFDDLILQTVRLFERSPETLQRFRQRFRHIAVDEFQDTNTAQLRLIELLAAGDIAETNDVLANSVTAIGDPDQAIYSFRGATSEPFRRFERLFPGGRIIRLSECYRSSPEILAAAGELIRHNRRRLHVALHSRAPEGPKLQVHGAATEGDEARFVVREMKRLIGALDLQDLNMRTVSGVEPEEHYSFADFAVLYRLHAVGSAIAEEFGRSGIPFQHIGGPLLREHQETRRLLAMCRILSNSVTGRLPDGLKSPIRGTACELTQSAELNGRMLRAMDTLASNCNGESDAPTVLAQMRDLLRSDTDTESGTACERLLAHSQSGESLNDFVRRLDLERYEDVHDARAAKVSLMTVHAAKGLEFGVVFLAGCEAGLMPWRGPGARTAERPIERPAGEEAVSFVEDGGIGQLDDELEEERRVFFVGMTRARRRLYLTWAASRCLFGVRTANRPSPFLNEIPLSLKGASDVTRPWQARGPRAKQRKLFLS